MCAAVGRGTRSSQTCFRMAAFGSDRTGDSQLSPHGKIRLDSDLILGLQEDLASSCLATMLAVRKPRPAGVQGHRGTNGSDHWQPSFSDSMPMKPPARPSWQRRLASIKARTVENCLAVELSSSEYDAAIVARFRRSLSHDLLTAWSPILGPSNSTSVARCEGMVGGSLFSSHEYPWPASGAGWAEPILQVSMTHINRMAGEPLGEGLLQLWMQGLDGHIRVIPWDAIRESCLTPEPQERQTTFSRMARVGYPITGYSSPYIYASNDMEEDVESYLDGFDIKKSIQADLKELVSMGKQQRASILLRSISFMGSFNSIQYSPGDIGRTIVALESGPYFGWGDSGNGQIALCADPGESAFRFHWQNC